MTKFQTMNYETFLDENSRQFVTTYTKRPSALEENLPAIETLIGKPFPQELIDFYSYADGLDIHFVSIVDPDQHFTSEFVPSLFYLFDEFKPMADKINWNDDSFMDEPFYETIWDEYTYQDAVQDFPSKAEGSAHFEFIRRQKLLIAINASSSNITIDFYDPEKEYQLYFQPNGRSEFYPLHCSIEQLLKVYLQIGPLDYWFVNFLSAEHKIAAGFHNVDFGTIQEFYPNFDWKLIERQ